MKVSKVNHTKSGVGVTKEQTKGILYANPNKTSENYINLETHLTWLNKKAQNLYSIFIPANRKIPENQKRFYSDMQRFSKKEIKAHILNYYKSEMSMDKNIQIQTKKLDLWIENIVRNGNDIKTYSSFENVKPENIDDVVDECLRKSLRKSVKAAENSEEIYIPELIKKFLKLVIKSELSQPEHLTSKEKETLLQVLNEDYGKSEQLKKIVHSIEAQNVRVNSVEKDGRILLQLANAEHKKKGQVFSFLKKFAAADNEAERENMLVHFKQLVLLFYCGKEKYKDTVEVSIPIWSWGMFEEDAAVNFDNDAYEMINELESLGSDKRNLPEKRKITDRMQKKLREKIATSYRQAVKAEGITEEDKYWLEYIENCAEKMLLGKKIPNPVRLSVSYLCEHTYREWISYICGKFIDMGKGVYHFTAPEDLGKVVAGETAIGEVLPEYRHNITSFDYERIKAEESLNRDISLYISFAVNNFAMSVVSSDKRKEKNNEDILFMDEDRLEKYAYDDADRRILRFFGGKSTWKDGELDGISNNEMVLAVKKALASVRNGNFHYTAVLDEKLEENSFAVLNKFFQKEFDEAGKIYRDKYYSNNVWMFYSGKDILSLMDTLYCREPKRPAQIPAFGKIINKSSMREIVDVAFIKGKSAKKIKSGDDSLECMEKFRNSLYFVLKEIYYYGFLQDDTIKEYFFDAMKKDEENLSKSKAADNNGKKKLKAAHNDFKEYLDILIECNRDITFGEICQQIMTEYNQQNQGSHTSASGRNGHEREKYKHFRTLLYLYIKMAFIEYLKKNECYLFLREPEKKGEKIEEESFCKEFCPHLHDNLRQEVQRENMLLSWYAMTHFLNQKQLNMLIGSIKNYMQYIQDIDRRCTDTDNRKGKNTNQKVEKYNGILKILEFSKLYCGSVTNCLEDYFKDEEDYAAHLANYVDFESKGKKGSMALKAFCSHPVRQGSPTGNIGLYYDELNPVINKNVVFAEMYGNEKLLGNCYQKISERDIIEYYKKKKELEEVFVSGFCKDIAQEEALREFQQIKNHIELAEVLTYSEIVNDLMGQLISWAYLRERDLMYYQLGFHYMRLFYSDCVEKENFLRQLKGEGISIKEGAVLYQIIAMYTYHLPMIIRDKETGNAEMEEKKSSNGKGVNIFYKGYCHDKGEIYESGLCLFEDVKKEHDDMVEFRNYIDHFKYYSHMDRSIMELYSDIYDRFFTYDTKLRKSVSFIFKNILQRYFVIAETEMRLGESERYKYKEEQEKVKGKATRILLKELEADEFAISKNNGEEDKKKRKESMTFARNKKFLGQLRKILEYKESVQ